MKVKGAVFDFNGVIVDDYPLQKDAWNDVSLMIRGKKVTDNEMMQNIRGVQTKQALRWMSKNSLSEETISQAAAKKEDLIRKMYANSPLFCLNKGLAVFFDELKNKNIPRTIATSSNLNEVRFSFNKLGLSQWFDINKIVYNDGSHKSKPTPDAYLLACQKINLNPSECVVFEDAASGIISAYDAGVRNIIAVGNDNRLDKLKKLPGVVKGIHNFSEITAAEIFYIISS